MKKLYTYIITSDNGQSPCYDNGIFTLACCKPQIRRIILQDYSKEVKNKTVDIWLCGIQRDNKNPFVVFLAKIDDVLRLEEYYGKDNLCYGRNDCHYHNVRTINAQNTYGKMQRKLSIDEIKRDLPSLYAEEGNEHGVFKNYNELSILSKAKQDAIIRDISGAAVLVSKQFIHCSCFKDNNELTKHLFPALGDVINEYGASNMRCFYQFDKWKEFDEIITKIPLGQHKNVKPVNPDKTDWIRNGNKKKNNICGGC